MFRLLRIFAVLAITGVSVQAQQKVYTLNAYEFDAPQTESVLDPVNRKLDLDKDKHLTLTGSIERSIFSQGGIGQAVNIYGKTLIIEEVNPQRDGSVELVMRQENGKDFFNFYPKVRTRLMPKAVSEEDKRDIEF